MEKLVKGKDYTLFGEKLIIREGVQYIPDGSFVSNNKIKQIILPSTLISIGQRAFENVSPVKSIIIPDNVITIQNNAFSNSSLEEVTFGKNLQFIGFCAFERCKITKVINNSNNLKLISNYAFSNSTNLKSFSKLDTTTYIFRGTFHRTEYNDKLCNLTRNRILNSSYDEENINEYSCNSNDYNRFEYSQGVLKIKDGVEIIGDFTRFKDCTRVEMPDSVLIIDYNAFKGLSKLESIKFSNNLVIIRDNSFSGCALRKEKLELPDSLCECNYSSFEKNDGDNYITLPIYTQFSGCFYTKKIYKYRNYRLDSNTNKYIIDINKLLSEEKLLLEKLNLLPENIESNKKLNKALSIHHSEIINKTFIEFLNDKSYDERTEILFIKSLLDSKEIDVSGIHDVVNHLFKRKQISTIYLLISYGYNYLDNFMISEAILNNVYEMIDVLLLLGSDINEVGINDMTPLSIACQKGEYTLVKYLIEKGAAINMIDKRNRRAIDYAIENNRQDIVELIDSYNSEKSEAESDLDAITRKLV